MEVTLMRNKHTGQVLYLEAGSNFVDFLLSFLLLPVGSILERAKPASLGALSSIANSINSSQLSDHLLSVSSEILRSPMIGVESKFCTSKSAELLKINVRTAQTRDYFCCNNNSCGARCYWLSKGQDYCPRCRVSMRNLMTLPPGELLPSAIVKDPNAALSMQDVDSSVITVAENEALQLLVAAFTSKTVLTDTFCVTHSATTDQAGST